MIKPEFLCHYTSVDVLCKLFTEMENENMSFHASSVDFMNDSAEYMTARNHCRDGVEEILMEEILGIPFALCFSDSENHIPMWNMYANHGKGVCLMFNFEELHKYFEILCNTKQDDFNSVKFSFCDYQEVNYKNEDEKPLFSNFEYPNTDELKKAITEDAFIKPLSFNYENEWRLMVWQSWYPTKKQKLFFKVRNDELCPYVKIPIPVDCLKQIILSPFASDQMIDSVRILIANFAPGHFINVLKSEISLKL